MQEGSATFTAGDDVIEATGGQVVVVPAGVAHKFVNSGAGRLRQVDIHTPATISLPSGSNDRGGSIRTVHSPRSPRLGGGHGRQQEPQPLGCAAAGRSPSRAVQTPTATSSPSSTSSTAGWLQGGRKCGDFRGSPRGSLPLGRRGPSPSSTPRPRPRIARPARWRLTLRGVTVVTVDCGCFLEGGRCSSL